MGQVRAIKASPAMEKEHLVTLMSIDKEESLDVTELEQLQKACQRREFSGNNGITAVPVSKKMPWMAVFNIPDEFIQDVKEGKKPAHRYYLAKIKCWKFN